MACQSVRENADGESQLDSLSFGMESSDQYVGLVSTKNFITEEENKLSSKEFFLILNLTN
jgi:hypothetical protein